MNRVLRTSLGLLFLLLTGAVTTTARAQANLTYFITQVDASAFPDVHFTLRAVDLGNQSVEGLNPSNLAVYENGEQVSEVEITPQSDGPITYLFVIDQGRASNYQTFGYNNLRLAITTLVSGGYFVDGRDTVLVLGRQNVNSDQTVTLLPPTQTATDLSTWAANFNFGRGSGATKGLLGVEDGIRRIQELNPVAGSRTAAILFITRYIEDPSATVAPTAAQNTGDAAASNYISVNVLQTDSNQVNKAALEILASASHGQYAGMRSNNYQSVVTSVYQAIAAQRAYYTVAYRSPVADSGQRQITINTPERPSEGAIGAYEITLQPPSISFVEPVPNTTIRREAEFGADGTTMTFDTSRVRVIAEVSWPDGFARNLESAELFANGNQEDSLQVVAGQTLLEFEWDVTDIVTQGVSPVTLELRLTDELGMLAQSELPVNIEVIIPGTPTPEGPRVTPPMVALGIPVLCIAGLALIGAAGGAFYLVRRRAASTGTASVAPPSGPSVTMMASDLSPAQALATLTVQEGPKGLVEEVLRIKSATTTIGRNPAQVDFAFYPDEESSVSRMHCTLTLEENLFKLTDTNSSAGTRLNGRKIQPGAPVILADGDEIVLGDLARRGVKLRFNLASEESRGPYSGTADDRTHLMGDFPGQGS
ncbi:MAG TPA: FHA domain-containing protein [Anaerolineales bacterium]